MKPQDVVFFVILLLLFRRPGWFLWVGLACFAVAIPLFSQWIFLTAERLTWYGATFMAVWLLVQLRK